jgi:hypothetical protein
MRIEKDGRLISSMREWQQFAPPKGENHWVEGRSACEIARAWCGTGQTAMPRELRVLLDSRPETRDMVVEVVEPEKKIRFDKRKGEPRNADLAFVGHVGNRRIAVTVEAKADEPFGSTVEETMKAARKRLAENPRSGGVGRVEDLIASLLPPGNGQAEALRYQLLTAVAGTLAYARDEKADLAVLIVHEFVTPLTSDELHEENEKAYRRFLMRLGGGSDVTAASASLEGPFRIPGGQLFPEADPILIGKVTTRLRTSPR